MAPDGFFWLTLDEKEVIVLTREARSVAVQSTTTLLCCSFVDGARRLAVGGSGRACRDPRVGGAAACGGISAKAVAWSPCPHSKVRREVRLSRVWAASELACRCWVVGVVRAGLCLAPRLGCRLRT